MKKKTIISSLYLLLAALILQTTGQRPHPAFAEGNYPNLGIETPLTTPNCNPNATTAVVSNNTQLQTALNNTAIKVICMNPGSYTEIKLETAGTAQSPRYLLPNHTGQTIPKPWNLPQNQRVIVDTILFKSAYWYVTGLNVVGDLGLIIEFRFGANGNVIDSMLIEGESERLPDGAGSRTMVRIRETAYYNTIQNSVLRNPPRVPHEDSHCLVIRDSRYNTIINNQFYDCAGDGIQINTADTAGWDNRGNKIFHNEIYLTERLYASCSDPSIDANLNGPGECACAENALDIKHNVNTPVSNNQDKMEIRSNTMYGFQETHQACGGTGDQTAPAIYLQNAGTKDVLIQGNLIAYSDTGIQLKDSGSGGPDNISVFNNMLFNIQKKRALHIAGGMENQFTHNTIVLTLDDGNLTGRHSIAILANAVSGIISNNLVLSSDSPYRGYIDAGANAGGGFIVQNNGYVAMATPITGFPGTNDMPFPNEPLSNFDQYCFPIETLTTNNYQCYPYLIPKPNAATVDTINTPSYGLTYDFFFNPRSLPYDLGATEIRIFDFHTMLPAVLSD